MGKKIAIKNGKVMEENTVSYGKKYCKSKKLWKKITIKKGGAMEENTVSYGKKYYKSKKLWKKIVQVIKKIV